LSVDWARPAAYGDLIAAVLALLALAALPSRLGIALSWIFNVWGLFDLLYAFYHSVIGVLPWCRDHKVAQSAMPATAAVA
jgi:hypothetical protein